MVTGIATSIVADSRKKKKSMRFNVNLILMHPFRKSPQIKFLQALFAAGGCNCTTEKAHAQIRDRCTRFDITCQ